VVDPGSRMAAKVAARHLMLRFLARHWELKLLALVFSSGLWLFVMTSQKTSVALTLPLELDSLPPGLVVKGEKPDTVEVQLHGLRADLARVSAESLRVRVNLIGARPGDLLVSLGPEQVLVPPGVRVVRVNPGVVRFVVVQER
jgi:YbbR domain-containing protein